MYRIPETPKCCFNTCLFLTKSAKTISSLLQLPFTALQMLHQLELGQVYQVLALYTTPGTGMSLQHV